MHGNYLNISEIKPSFLSAESAAHVTDRKILIDEMLPREQFETWNQSRSRWELNTSGTREAGAIFVYKKGRQAGPCINVHSRPWKDSTQNLGIFGS